MNLAPDRWVRQYDIYSASGNGVNGSSEEPVSVPNGKHAGDDVRFLIDRFFEGEAVVYAIDGNGDLTPVDPTQI